MLVLHIDIASATRANMVLDICNGVVKEKRLWYVTSAFPRLVLCTLRSFPSLAHLIRKRKSSKTAAHKVLWEKILDTNGGDANDGGIG